MFLERITEAGAGFRSLTESIDTTTAAGRMMLQMLGAFAEFERSMVKERTRLGLKAARERGRVGETAETDTTSAYRSNKNGNHRRKKRS
jgi:DNA invertase Pin-like site-specific DNA recombinase